MKHYVQVDELKIICMNTEGCVAFNELGDLKSATKPLVRSTTTNVWIWDEGGSCIKRVNSSFPHWKRT